MKHCYLVFLFLLSISCNTIDLYEQTEPFPKQEWKDSERPAFTFNIQDTTALYNIYVVFRHTDAYNFNNLWLNIITTPPGDSASEQKIDLKLADNTKGWLGRGLDDIFEHRIKITREPVFLRKGVYKFTLQHIMREEPLQHVMNAGIRVEKVK